MTAALDLGTILRQTEHAIGVIRQCNGVSAEPGTDLHTAVTDALRSAAGDLEECAWLLNQIYWRLKHEGGDL